MIRRMSVRGGLDLGGTKIQAIVFDTGDERVLGEARRPTPQEGGPPAVVDALVDALREAAQAAGRSPVRRAGGDRKRGV